jgi:malate synthase
MEDAATAEIARSQVWQWVHNEVKLDTGAVVSAELVRHILDEELAKIRDAVGDESFDADRFAQARELVVRVALAGDYADFLTLPAYQIAADE